MKERVSGKAARHTHTRAKRVGRGWKRAAPPQRKKTRVLEILEANAFENLGKMNELLEKDNLELTQEEGETERPCDYHGSPTRKAQRLLRYWNRPTS